MAIRLKDTASVNISGSAGSAGSATKATQDASGNVITSTYATKSELTSGLSGKVDKVSGKGLSTNDFTTALKTKLEGLSNYDDTALTTAVNNLTTRFNTLLETDTTAAIESFNEIIAFLNGIADTETLEGIVAGIESQISTVEGKIPTKVSQLTNDSGYVKNTAVATSSALGLIKSGGDITVASDGTVSVANNSHTHTIANITNLQTTLDGKASTAVATASSAGLMSAEDKAALDGLITTGGEVNQNAFSNVKVGSTTIAADSKTDTLELAAGTNVTLTPDATNDKVTIAAKDTTYTFANGTNGFTVTPSGGTAQTVTVTPSIANNVTGSGTSGYLTKFNGANSVTNGPQLGTSTTTYLRNDGTWATPKDTTYSALSATDATAGTATTGRLISAKVLHDKITEMLPDEVTTTEGDTGLMTAADKSKLDGIAEGANKYTHPTYTAKSSGLYKITVDEIGHVSGTTAVAKSDITALGIPGSDTNTTYTFKSGTNKFTVTPSNGTATDITVTPSITNNVTYTGTLVDEQVAAFEGTSGTIKASGYTIAKSVPSDAKFTDTDTKVTAVGNHYTPAEDTSAAINASASSATNVTGSSAAVNVVTGLKRDAAGHVVGVTSSKIYSTDTKSFTITATATDDDVVVLTGTNGSNKVTFDAKHAKKFSTSDETYTSGNTTTSISGASGSGTIKIPQITVDSYGHVTAAADEDVTITMPAVPVTSVAGKTGAVTLSKSDVGLGNVTNESKATMFTNAALTGNPTAPTQSAGNNSTRIATTAFVQTEIANKIAAADAMIYKGTIGSNTGDTVSELPSTTAKTGWTYKVATAGTYAGSACEVGDMIICLTDGSSSTAATWTVVQNNIDGAVTGPASSVSGQIAVFDGTTGKVIKDSGFTIATSVPSGAKFTDTNTKVTSAANHYDPAEDTSAAISAASGTATDVTGTSGKLNVVTGVKRDAKGHIVGVTSANIYSKNTTYSAGNGLTLSGTTLAVGAGTGISVSADAVGLATSGVTAGSYGPEANVSGGSGATISVPSITVDDYGRVTSIANKTYTSSTLPTSLKNPTSMTVQLNGGTTEGTNKFTYDGSTAKSLNITASSVGAAASSHTHTKSEITDFPTLATVATSGSYNDLSNKPTIPTVPSSLKNPNSITFKGAGTSVFSYDGSAAKSLDIVAGSNVTVTADATNSKITIAATDTTYSSKSAASGGTAVSLVTTGEKYTWNSKASTTTASGTANGLMSSAHYTKLEGIATGATKVTTDTVSGWGYTKNAGTVTSVKVGTTSYSPSSGVVSLPAYPTTLPASDVSSWAKATSKPTYTYSEVGAAPASHTQAYSTLTGSGTTANQAIVSTGTANKWTLKTLGSNAFNSTTIPTNTNQLTNGAGFITGITKSMVTTALGYTPPTTNTTYSVATTSANGLMSSTDKSRLDFMHKANSRTTLASIPVTGSIVTATLSAATSISVAAAMTIGQSVTVICTPSASFTQPIPTSGSFISMDGDSLKVTSGKKFEINILCYASGKYSISCKTAV